MKVNKLGVDIQFVRAAMIALTVTLLGSVANPADAEWTRTHASDCKTLGGAPIDTSYAIYNNSTTQEMVFLCAVHDDDRFLKQNITTLNIHGWDGHSSLQASAMACRSL